VYCDSSALVKLSVSEPYSDAVNRALEGRDDLLVSDLAARRTVPLPRALAAW
jgi:hypothetical protein